MGKYSISTSENDSKIRRQRKPMRTGRGAPVPRGKLLEKPYKGRKPDRLALSRQKKGR